MEIGELYGIVFICHAVVAILCLIKLKHGTPRDKYIREEVIRGGFLHGTHPRRKQMTSKGIFLDNIFWSCFVNLLFFLAYLWWTGQLE